MKKFLSLVLALVMTMSLVTVAGAADFDDAADIKYAEAVEVLEAVGVVSGYGDGSFRPEVQLNRGQAAKIICNLILGPTTAEALPTDVAPFSDVAAGSTFAGYIAYCAKEGVINGYNDGTFRPTAPLTGYAFMKMLLATLGYDGAIEGFTGSNWAVSVAKLALANDLEAGLEGAFAGTKIVTREEACLYAFNTLKALDVEYANNSTITVGDITISSNTKAEPVDTAAYYVELFKGDLDLDESASVVDAYGRPAHTWSYKGDEIGTYADEAAYVATSNVKVYDVRKALGLKTNETVKFGGVDLPVANSKSTAKIADTWAAAGNGVTVEFFYDEDDTYALTTDDYNKVVVIDEKVGKITKVKTTDDGTFAYIGAKSFETDEFAKDDIVLYTLNTLTEIETMIPAEKLTGTCTKVTDGKYTIDGVVYELHKGYAANDLAVGTEVEFYLDSCGYIIKDDATEASADLENLMFVLKHAASGFDEIAEVVFGNGEKSTITVKADDFSASDIKSGIISVKEKSGKYEKTAPAGYTAAAAGSAFTNGAVTVGTYKVDAGTQFVYVDADNNVKTYVGFKNAPTVTGASIYVYYKTVDSVAKAADLVVVNAGSVETKADALTYVIYDDYKAIREEIGEDTYNYYVFNTVDGETLKVDADSVNFATMWADLQAKAGVGALALKSITTDADGYVTNWTVEADTTKVLTATSTAGIAVAEDGGVVTVGSASYSYDEVVVYAIEDAEATEIEIAGIDAKYTGVTTILDDGVVTGLILVKEVEEA